MRCADSTVAAMSMRIFFSISEEMMASLGAEGVFEPRTMTVLN